MNISNTVNNHPQSPQAIRQKKSTCTSNNSKTKYNNSWTLGLLNRWNITSNICKCNPTSQQYSSLGQMLHNFIEFQLILQKPEWSKSMFLKYQSRDN